MAVALGIHLHLEELERDTQTLGSLLSQLAAPTHHPCPCRIFAFVSSGGHHAYSEDLLHSCSVVHCRTVFSILESQLANLDSVQETSM